MQPGLLEVVVAAADAGGTGIQTLAEALDHRQVGDQAGVLLVGHRRQLGEGRLVVAEHQQVPVGAVLEVIVETFLFAQALDEVQVALVVLGAVVARRVDGGAELEAVGVGEDAVFLQHPGDDLRHRQLLENALVMPMREVGQARHQAHLVAGQALAGFALGHPVQLAMDAVALPQVQVGALVQQAFQVQVGTFADQFDVEAVGLVQGFAAMEFEHLQVAVEAVDIQAEMGLVGRGEHPMFLCAEGLPGSCRSAGSGLEKTHRPETRPM